jgi:hypothetical protein
MTTINATMDVSANRPGDRTCTIDAQPCTINDAVINFVRELAPRKTWAFLTEKFGICERTAKHRLAGTRKFESDELAQLLWTEEGFYLFAAIMDAAPKQPLWWRICKPLMEVSDIERKQLVAKRKLQAVLTGALGNDAQLSADIEASRAAISRQDPDFYVAHAEAVRAVTRAPGRPMAKVRR